MLGKVKRATRKFDPVGQFDTPGGQAGLVAASRLCMPLSAHWNSVTPPAQLLSVVFIDPVESTMMATFQGWAMPCMDDVAVADTVTELKPNNFMKNVGTLVDCVTTTALSGAPGQPDPFGISVLRHFVDTLV